MILIIDNRSSYLKKFKRDFLQDQNFPYQEFDHNEALHLPANTEVKGVILSGGTGNPYDPLNLTANFVALMNFQVPTIGFCLGHEIIAVASLGRIRKLPDYHAKKEKIHILDHADPIFDQIQDEEILLQKKHHYHVTELPESFVTLGKSEACPHEIIRHRDKPLYGFQSHPEVSGPVGIQIMRNFFTLCGLTTN